MSQIDKANFIPNLFWFLVLFFFLYLYIVACFLPMIYQSLKIREFFFLSLIVESIILDVLSIAMSLLHKNHTFIIFLQALFILNRKSFVLLTLKQYSYSSIKFKNLFFNFYI